MKKITTKGQNNNSLINLKAASVVRKQDLLGEQKPSILFYPMVGLLSHLLSCDTKKMISKGSVRIRRFLHPILLCLLPLFLDYKQVLESKNALLGIDASDVPLELPDEPVIWCANHGFKDDAAATIGTARHAYVLFGSLPMFFNTFDGVGAYINGVVICNRKEKASKQAAMLGVKCLMDLGMDILIFPEGVWNKTPDKLLLDLWPGTYRLAKEKGSKVIPIIHYLANPHKKYKGNVIHTVIADPICMDGLDEVEGLQLLRDAMATWYYLLMEKYGQTTRKELLEGFETADEAWETYMSMHTGCVKYYDKEIELCADYRLKTIVRPEDVWQNIANATNIHVNNVKHIQYARRIVEQEKRRDFQRRF